MARPKKDSRSSRPRCEDSDREGEREKKTEASKKPAKISRQSCGGKSDSSADEARQRNRRQGTESVSSLNSDKHKNNGSFFKKTVRKVLRSVTPTREKNSKDQTTEQIAKEKSASKGASCTDQQGGSGKNTKKLVPRDTKASLLRRKIQSEKNKSANVSTEKTVKSSALTASPVDNHGGLKQNDSVENKNTDDNEFDEDGQQDFDEDVVQEFVLSDKDSKDQDGPDLYTTKVMRRPNQAFDGFSNKGKPQQADQPEEDNVSLESVIDWENGHTTDDDISDQANLSCDLKKGGDTKASLNDDIDARPNGKERLSKKGVAVADVSLIKSSLNEPKDSGIQYGENWDWDSTSESEGNVSLALDSGRLGEKKTKLQTTKQDMPQTTNGGKTTNGKTKKPSKSPMNSWDESSDEEETGTANEKCNKVEGKASIFLATQVSTEKEKRSSDKRMSPGQAKTIVETSPLKRNVDAPKDSGIQYGGNYDWDSTSESEENLILDLDIDLPGEKKAESQIAKKEVPQSDCCVNSTNASNIKPSKSLVNSLDGSADKEVRNKTGNDGRNNAQDKVSVSPVFKASREKQARSLARDNSKEVNTCVQDETVIDTPLPERSLDAPRDSGIQYGGNYDWDSTSESEENLSLDLDIDLPGESKAKSQATKKEVLQPTQSAISKEIVVKMASKSDVNTWDENTEQVGGSKSGSDGPKKEVSGSPAVEYFEAQDRRPSVIKEERPENLTGQAKAVVDTSPQKRNINTPKDSGIQYGENYDLDSSSESETNLSLDLDNGFPGEKKAESKITKKEMSQSAETVKCTDADTNKSNASPAHNWNGDSEKDGAWKPENKVQKKISLFAGLEDKDMESPADENNQNASCVRDGIAEEASSQENNLDAKQDSGVQNGEKYDWDSSSESEGTPSLDLSIKPPDEKKTLGENNAESKTTKDDAIQSTCSVKPSDAGIKLRNKSPAESGDEDSGKVGTNQLANAKSNTTNTLVRVSPASEASKDKGIGPSASAKDNEENPWLTDKTVVDSLPQKGNLYKPKDSSKKYSENYDWNSTSESEGSLSLVLDNDLPGEKKAESQTTENEMPNTAKIVNFTEISIKMASKSGDDSWDGDTDEKVVSKSTNIGQSTAKKELSGFSGPATSECQGRGLDVKKKKEEEREKIPSGQSRTAVDSAAHKINFVSPKDSGIQYAGNYDWDSTSESEGNLSLDLDNDLLVDKKAESLTTEKELLQPDYSASPTGSRVQMESKSDVSGGDEEVAIQKGRNTAETNVGRLPAFEAFEETEKKEQAVIDEDKGIAPAPEPVLTKLGNKQLQRLSDYVAQDPGGEGCGNSTSKMSSIEVPRDSAEKGDGKTLVTSVETKNIQRIMEEQKISIASGLNKVDVAKHEQKCLSAYNEKDRTRNVVETVSCVDQLKDSALQSDILEKGQRGIQQAMPEENKVEVQLREALSEKDIQIKQLIEEIEKRKFHTEEKDEEKNLLKKEIEAKILKNEALFRQIDGLEQKLELSQSKNNMFQVNLETVTVELSRQRSNEEKNLEALDEGKKKIKWLKEKYKELVKEKLKESNGQREELESLKAKNKKLMQKVHGLEEKIKMRNFDKEAVQGELKSKSIDVSGKFARDDYMIRGGAITPKELYGGIRRKVTYCDNTETDWNSDESEENLVDEQIESMREALYDCQERKIRLKDQANQLQNDLLAVRRRGNRTLQTSDAMSSHKELEDCGGYLSLSNEIETKRVSNGIESNGIPKTDISKGLQKPKTLYKERDWEDERSSTTVHKDEEKTFTNVNVSDGKDYKLQQEISLLKKSVTKMESRLVEQEMKLEEARKEIEQSRKEMKSMRCLLTEKDTRINALQNDVEKSETLIKKSNKELERINTCLREKDDELMKVEKTKGEELDSLKKYIDETQKKVEKLERAAEFFKKEVVNARLSLTKRDSELQQSRTSVMQREKELKSVKRRLKDIEDELAHWKAASRERKTFVGQGRNTLKNSDRCVREGDERKTKSPLPEGGVKKIECVKNWLNENNANGHAWDGGHGEKGKYVTDVNGSPGEEIATIKRLHVSSCKMAEDMLKLFKTNLRMIRDLDEVEEKTLRMREMQTSHEQKIPNDATLRDRITGMDKIGRQLEKSLDENEREMNKLSTSLTQFKQQYEEMSNFARENDIKFIGQENAGVVGELEMKDLKSQLRKVGEMLHEWIELSKFRGRNFREMGNQALKENAKTLELIVRQQRRDMKRLKTSVVEKDEDIATMKNALEECRKEVDKVKALLAEKDGKFAENEGKVNEPRQRLSFMEHTSCKDKWSLKHKMEEKKLGKTVKELDNIKKENLILSTEKQTDANKKILNALYCVRRQKEEIRELKAKLKGTRNKEMSSCSRKVLEKRRDPPAQETSAI